MRRPERRWIQPTSSRATKGQYIEIEPEELEAIAIESKRTIEIDEFVPKKEIDDLYQTVPTTSFPMAKSANRRSRSSSSAGPRLQQGGGEKRVNT
jgi:hypothetical protein